MYSVSTRQWLEKERFRAAIRRWRRGTLFVTLGVILVWGATLHRADQGVFAWNETVEVAVVALVDAQSRDSVVDAEAFMQRFLSRTAPPRHNLRHVEEWMHEQYTARTGNERRILRFDVLGPVMLDEPPPAVPEKNASFIERLAKTRGFLSYFQDISEREELHLDTYDVTIFIYFYDFHDRERSKVFGARDSIASRRDRLGVVFAPLTHGLLGHTCVVTAHELCHTLGARDKYRNGFSVYPEGYVEPERRPLHPQPLAEIMAMALPIEPGKEELAVELEHCAVGRKTAEEMGWTVEEE